MLVKSISNYQDHTNIIGKDHTMPNFQKHTNTIAQKIQKKIRERSRIDLELDCEYYDSPFDKANRETLSTQIRESDLDSKGVLFTHGRDILDCPKRKYPNPIVEYLNLYGVIENSGLLEESDFNLLLEEGKDFFDGRTVNYMVVNIWTFFGIVDWARAFTGRDAEFLNEVILGRYNNIKLEQNKRLETSWQTSDSFPEDYIPTRQLIRVPGVGDLVIFLRSMDISAMLGADMNLKKAAESVGVNLPIKDSMDVYKTDMREAVELCPKDFVEYSLADLVCKRIHDEYNKLYKSTLKMLKLPTEDAKLTVGGTVNKMIRLFLEKETSINFSEKVMKKYHLDEGTAKKLLKANGRSRQLLGKVDGGRCNNNKPWIPNDQSYLCDIDISSCYQSVMNSLSYPLGEPLIIDHAYSKAKVDDREKLYTLASFLDEFKDELVDGLWVLRVSTPEGYKLKNQQDLISSFIPPKNMSDYKSGCDNDGHDFSKTQNGELKIFYNQIINGVINSDILELLQKYSNASALKEYMTKLNVVAAIFYPKSARATSMEQYLKQFEANKGETTTQVLFSGTSFIKRTEEDHNHVWFDVPLNSLVSTLQNERNKASKQKNIALEKVLKSIINTVYGDIVSPKFHTSNAVLAQNITARARAAAYTMEKALNMYLTITDGGIFNPKKVITAGKRNPSVQNLTAVMSPRSNNLKYKSLEYTTKEELEAVSLNHVFETFSELSIVKNRIINFVIKVDDKTDYIPRGASFQGSANYLLNYKVIKVKKRSYNDSKTFDYLGNPLKISEPLLFNILNDPSSVKRSPIAYQDFILKTKQYKKSYNKIKETTDSWGFSSTKTKHLLEFSLNQFNFLTYEQFKSWKKQITKLKQKYGQTLEMFYLNQDKTLDFQQMIFEVYEDIMSGKMKPRVLIDKNRHSNRKYSSHPLHKDYNNIVI